MKSLIVLFLILFCLPAQAADKESFLAAWEDLQKSSPEVARFEKTGDGTYQVKFATLPFEGELRVLAYDVEELNYAGLANDDYSFSGYVEVELVGAPEDLVQKYSRTYYRWAANNNLYFSKKTGRWITGKEFSEAVQSDLTGSTGFWVWVAQYSNYILAALFIYILYTLIFGNRHMKQSLAQQKQAMDEMDQTRKQMERALELNEDSNRLLAKILEVLENKKN